MFALTRLGGRRFLVVAQNPDGVVEFGFFRPEANQVSLAGDFNDWRCDTTLMAKGADGWWRIKLKLEAGTYRFKYLADNQWHTDYAAFGVEISPYGWNSVLKVDPPKPRLVQVQQVQADPQAA